MTQSLLKPTHWLPWLGATCMWLLTLLPLQSRAQVYYTLNDGSATATTDQLRSVTAGGTGDVLIKDNFVQIAGPAVLDAANNRVLVADTRPSQASTSLTNTKIVAVSLAAGNAASTLITPTYITGSTSTTVTGLDIDRVNNYLYYTLSDGNPTATTDQLRRINLDGTGDVLIKDNFVQTAGPVVLDAANNRVLVADTRLSQSSTSLTNTKIVAVSLAAGNAVSTLITPTYITGSTSTVVGDLAIDRVNNYLYYTLNDGSATATTDQLRRINLDGTGDVLIKDNFVQIAGPAVLDAANNRVLVADTRPSQASTSLTNTKIVAVSLAAGNAASTLITPTYITGSTSTVVGGLALLEAVPPTVTTTAAASVTTNSAALGGAVTNDGGTTITNRGVVYSATNTTPAIGGSGVTQAVNSATTNTFSATISGLTPGTTYYVRAYATNSAGTSYGSVVSFTTSTTIVSITRASANPTNAATVSYTVTFGSPVTGLTAANFSLTPTGTASGTIGTPVAGAGNTWTVPINSIAGSGTLTLNLANDTNLSADIITTLPFSGETYTIDRTAPTVSSSNRQSPATAATNATSLTFRVTFSEAVTGVTTASFTFTPTGTVSGSIASVASVSGSGGTQFDVTVNGVSGNGTGRLDVKSSGSGITDAAGNALSGGYTAGQTYTVDQTAPTMIISSTAGANNSTTATTPIPFTVTFSESVTGFVQAGVTVGNGTISGFAGSGTTYTFSVTPTTPGTATTVNVPANVAQDAAGNGNTAAPAAYALTYQPPTAAVVSVTGLTPSPTATAQVSYQVVFSAPVSGLTTGNFNLTTSGVSGASVTSVSGSGTTYTVVAATGTGDGTLRLDVNNGTGATPGLSNVPYTSGTTYTLTRNFSAAPTLRIQAAGSASGNGDVTAFVDQVQVLHSGTSTAVANGLQNGGFDANNVPAGGYLYQSQGVAAAPWSFGVQAGVSRNNSAFGSTAAGGDAVAFLQSAAGNNGSAAQNLAVPTGSYQVNFQAIQRSYTARDQRLNVFVNDVFVGGIQPNPTPTYEPFTSAPFNVVAPALTATVSTPAASPTGAAPVPFSVTFSQSVGTSFAAADVTVTGGTLTSGSFSGSGAGPYAFAVTPTGTGTVSVSLAANVASDANNTGNAASNTVSVQYNQPVTAAPVITAPANGSLTNQAVTINGTAPAGSTVNVYVSQNGAAFQFLDTYTASAGGTFSSPAFALPSATYQVYATAQSPGASVSANSNTNTFTVDLDRPAVVLTSSSGASGSTNVAAPFTFTATFSEGVTGFVAGDLSVTNGTVSNFTGASGGSVYTFNVTPNTPGVVTSVYVFVNSSQDAAGNGNTVSNTYSLTSAAPVVTVAPASGSLPGGTVGIAYSQTITASGATAPYTYAITAGALPAGLTLSSAGVLSGTPTGSGPFTFTVTATDNSAAPGPYSGSRTYTLTIARPTIAVAPATLPNGTVGTAYSQTLTASGGSGAYTYAITAGATPTGLSISAAGVLSGTPTAANTFNFTVTATDAFGSTGSQAYTVTIVAAPVVTSVTWTGALSTDWFTAGNWTSNTVPTATIDATIPTSPSGGRFPALTTTALANARNLTLNSGATLTHTNGTLTLAGNLTNNGSYNASYSGFSTGPVLSLGTAALNSIVGSSTTRFWNLTVGTNGAALFTSAGAVVQRVLTLNGNFSTNGNQFTLESTASGTAMVVNNGGSVVNGNVTVQRYIDPSLNPNLGYRHVSAAVSNATVASLATSGFSPVVNPAYNTSPTPLLVNAFPTVYGYDQSRLATTNNNLNAFDKGWYSPNATTDALTVGQGYTVLIGGGQTWNFTGPLNNGNVTQNLARNAGATAPAAGYALLGNPYPSPLDWSQTSSQSNAALNGLVNVDPTMYVYRSNDPTNPYTGVYGFYNNGIGTTSPVVAQGQGFFVRVSDGQTAGSVTFKNSQRPTTYQPTTYQRTTETRPLVELHLQVTGSAVNDAAFVYFEQGATDAFDAQYDAEKLPNPSGLNLSTSLSATQRLAIDGRAPLGTTQRVVPLAVGVPAVGSYTLSTAQLLNLGTTPVYLRDLQSGAVIDLRTQPSYSFTVSNASALITGRFELVFSPQAVLATAPAALAAQVGLYPNPTTTTAFVELPAALGRTAVVAELVDALGRTVRTQSLPARGAAPHRLSLADLASGVYTLHLKTSAGIIVKKLVME